MKEYRYSESDAEPLRNRGGVRLRNARVGDGQGTDGTGRCSSLAPPEAACADSAGRQGLWHLQRARRRHMAEDTIDQAACPTVPLEAMSLHAVRGEAESSFGWPIRAGNVQKAGVDRQGRTEIGYPPILSDHPDEHRARRARRAGTKRRAVGGSADGTCWLAKFSI